MTKLPENPEKNGFVFTGWNTAKDGSGQEVTDQTVVEGDMTVFAVFDDLKSNRYVDTRISLGRSGQSGRCETSTSDTKTDR